MRADGRATVTETFDSRRDALHAVDRLRRNGFTEDQISVFDLAGDRYGDQAGARRQGTGSGTGFVVGAIIGAIIGGVLAWLLVGASPWFGAAITAATVPAVIVGAVIGFIVGGIIGAAIAASTGRDRTRSMAAGARRAEVVVTVPDATRVPEAQALLHSEEPTPAEQTAPLRPLTADRGAETTLDGERLAREKPTPVVSADLISDQRPVELRPEHVATFRTVEEELVPEKHVEQLGTVHVRTEVEQTPGRLEVEAMREDVVIEHEPAGEVVAERVEPWEENGDLVIPVYEEHLVVVKRLVMREKIRVRREPTTERQVFEDRLRRDRLVVDDADRTGRVRELYPTGEENAPMMETAGDDQIVD